ncbi:hypothetical protein K469DRAFT_698868 [Zopfia rhizophila CBS 207.26]|uniref:Uncharacterized protein n=1 Tax=Zopfia rhizophila CBS 207.26 TaxID=1314779 RepID=A0A6A6EWY8_9PEZI|nr:hypothetical protein K469DRAFT_698868 [Zopfia rhizophila CBS 207.26]
MAAFGQALGANIPLPATSERAPSSKRPLPNGPCNYRDLAIGTCGCSQFWDKCSADLHEGSSENRSSSERSTWCVCGHHACFHQQEPRSATEIFLPSLAAPNPRALPRCDGRYLLHPGSQCNAHRGLRPVEEESPPLEGSLGINNGRFKASQTLSSQRLPRQGTSQATVAGANQQALDTPSQPSASGLPRVPSVCLLNSHELRPVSDAEVRKVRNDVTSQSRQSPAGLGLSLMNLGSMGDRTDRRQSVSSTILDEINKQQNASYSESEIPSTRANSIPGENTRQPSPRLLSIDRILEYNRNLPHLEVGGDTVPDTFNPDEFMQSATEVATPSNANTPDLRAADQAVHDTKKLIENLTHLTSTEHNGAGLETRPNSANSGGAPQLLLTNSPATPQEQLQQALRSASPQALQRLVSYLNPVHNLLNSIPNVANTLRDLSARLDGLENNSFNYVQPEDFNHQLEQYDGRLLELEHRMDDHDKLHAAIDADHSSNSFIRRRTANVTDSFGSNHSAPSVTSSALIVAAMDRKEIETEFEGIKARLDALEAAAMPSFVDPWEVEIVFLPWGRELRGIWFSPDEPVHDPKSVTQDTEEWTQARSLRSFSRSSLPFNDAGSGWSSQAISDWADTTHEWLSPKACGSNNLVYKRLHSRGFIRNVTLKSANSGDIQTALSNAFGNLLEHFKDTHDTNDQNLDAFDQAISSYPGLKAPFIPLRKIMKSSRLRFLTHAEMSSSALWTAQFLASGVLMRVSGDKKRLYVTQREAYLQQSDHANSSWTWRRLRELPRVQSDPDSQMERNEEHCQPQVAEADAKEACWAFFPAYDPPVSTTSSFSSTHSAQLSIRPVDRQWHRSITPSSILKNKQSQPISPHSEIHPRHPAHRRNRTVSGPVVEEPPQSSSKRRLNLSFEHSQKRHSGIPHNDFQSSSSRSANAPASKPKRRRVTLSPSPRPAPNSHPQEAQVVIWTKNTPRQSREPPSPFFSSHPELPRSNSDVTSRSQRSAALVGKSTPFAYATPHSGPLVGGAGFGGFGDGEAGDTEVDDDDDADDDGQSWRGVEDHDEGSGSDSGDDSDAEGGAEMGDQASFLAKEDSVFGSENDDDLDDGEFGFGAQAHEGNGSEDEIFDTLLGVLEH